MITPAELLAQFRKQGQITDKSIAAIKYNPNSKFLTCADAHPLFLFACWYGLAYEQTVPIICPTDRSAGRLFDKLSQWLVRGCTWEWPSCWAPDGLEVFRFYGAAWDEWEPVPDSDFSVLIDWNWLPADLIQDQRCSIVLL
jgi:hypothetical protein